MIQVLPSLTRRLFFFFLIAVGAQGVVLAERPPAPDLLPDKTLALLRIPDVREFVERVRETSMGRMFKDEQMRPLVERLYGNALQAYEKIQENVGLPLDRLLAIPQGEMFLAAVAMPEGPPAVVLLIDVKNQLPAATKLLDRLVEQAEKDGNAKTTEAIGDAKLTILTPAGKPPALAFFEKDGAVVLATNVDAAKSVHNLWSEPQAGEVMTLATNRKFTTIMNRCQGARDDRPQLSFYADPIEFVRATTRGNVAAQTGLAILPALGLDGLLGVGGSSTFITGEFDAVSHIHLLLEQPRSGVIKALAAISGDSTPEPWVPHNIATYSTIHWDFETTLNEVKRLLDTFQGDGAYANAIRSRLSEPLGVDFDKEILAALESRISYVTWFEKPARLNSQSHLIAVKLNDSAAFRPTLEKIIEKYSERFEKKSFGGVTYYLAPTPNVNQPNPNRQRDANNEPRMELRTPAPCLAILGDYFVATDSETLLQQCVIAKNDPDKSLAAALDFKLIASKTARQVGGGKPAAITFNRPEDGFRFLYDLANAEGTRKNLAKGAENNEVLRGLNSALKDHPLPPFSVLEKYFAPNGAMLTDDETGFHYTTFTLRRK